MPAYDIYFKQFVNESGLLYTYINQSIASIIPISADEMPMTCNTIVFVAIGIDPVIGAAAMDANVAAKLEKYKQRKYEAFRLVIQSCQTQLILLVCDFCLCLFYAYLSLIALQCMHTCTKTYLH
jgi:hypothetical protein